MLGLLPLRSIKKAKTIERALRSITDNPGSKLFFITLTTSRYANPSDVLDIQNKALNSVFGNFKTKLIEMGIRKEGIGTIKALIGLFIQEESSRFTTIFTAFYRLRIKTIKSMISGFPTTLRTSGPSILIKRASDMVSTLSG